MKNLDDLERQGLPSHSKAELWHWQSESRYYTVRLQTDLFGYWSLTRNWGGRRNRINGCKLKAFEKYDDAKKDVEKIFTIRKKRGYEAV